MGKPKKPFSYRSEFNAGAMDFERFDIILKKADDLMCLAILGNSGVILQYYAVISNFYLNLRPLLEVNKKTDIIKSYDEYFELLSTKIFAWAVIKNKSYPIGLYKILASIHGDLLYLRQMIGLGIPMSKSFADSTIIRKGLGVKATIKGDIDSLE